MRCSVKWLKLYLWLISLENYTLDISKARDDIIIINKVLTTIPKIIKFRK